MAKVVEGHRQYCLLNCSLLIYIAHLNWKHQIYLTKAIYIIYMSFFLFFFGFSDIWGSRKRSF